MESHRNHKPQFARSDVHSERETSQGVDLPAILFRFSNMVLEIDVIKRNKDKKGCYLFSRVYDARPSRAICRPAVAERHKARVSDF